MKKKIVIATSKKRVTEPVQVDIDLKNLVAKHIVGKKISIGKFYDIAVRNELAKG